MKRIRAKVISNERVAPERFRMRLEAPTIASQAKPGQFVMIQCSPDLVPLLRRPLAFHRIGRRHFDLLYQVVGKGTHELSQRKTGEKIDILGPLGNSFSPSADEHVILIAGGIALAPLLALAEKGEIKKSNNRLVIIGARTKSHVLCTSEFRHRGFKVKVATEDGSMGRRGLATDILKSVLRAVKQQSRVTIYGCGPKAMLKELARMAKAKNITCQVSLEEKMACGTGVCLGCAVKTVVGYKMVCKDGPVFHVRDILW